MANIKEYRIVINGIQESINAVNSLNETLSNLETRINNLSSKNINIGNSSVVTKVDISGLQEQDRLLKQIQATEQKIAEARSENYQQLLAQKDLLKEATNDAQQRAAQERLAADTYSNTMEGLKQELSDVKRIMQTTDLGDNEFQELTKRASELNTKLKELEQSYGQFGRNVGNYPSAFDGIKNITVQVGGATREFNSVRDASRQLTQELKALVIQGKESTQEFKDLAEAVHAFEMASRRAESAVNDLKASSQGMDDMLDMMESFTAIGSVSQGFSALFGFDDDEIQKSIQKLVALQNVLQGIEKLRQQMNTGEGIGGLLSKGYANVDKMQKSMMRTNVALLGTGRSARIAAVGIKAMGTAIKGFATLGIGILLDLLVEGITKVSELVSKWIKGDADLIESTDALNSSIDEQNDRLERNLDLIKKRTDAGELSALDARIEKEKAYAKALLDSAEALKKRQETYDDEDIVNSRKTNINLSNAIGDKGVTTVGGFSRGIKDINDFTERFEYLLGRVENGKDIFGSFIDTASDARDELVHMTKLVGGDFYNAMQKFSDGTAEGSRKLAEYIREMDKLTNGAYSQAIKIGIDKGYLDGQFKQAWTTYQNFKKDVALDPIELKLNFESLANQFIEAADKTKSAYYKRQLDALNDAYNQLSEEEQKRQRERYYKAKAAIEKQATDTRKQALSQAKRTAQQEAKQVEAAQKELNSLRIAQMREGLNKTIKQLEEERRQKIAKIKSDGIMVAELTAEANKLYNKKIEDAEKKHAEEVKKTYEDMWSAIFNINLSNYRLMSELAKKENDKMVRDMNEAKNKLMNQGISSYGIQGKNQLSDSTKDLLGIISTYDDETVNDHKKFIDMNRESAAAYNAYAVARIQANDNIEAAEEKLKKVEEETNKKLQQLELDKAFMFDDEYEKKKHSIEKELDVERKKLLTLKETSEAEVGLVKMTYEAKQRLVDEYEAELKRKYDTEEKQEISHLTMQLLLEENYSKDLSTTFKQRMTAVESYWTARISSEKTSAQALYEQNVELENKEYEDRRRNNKEEAEKLQKQTEKSLEDGKISEENAREAIERIWKEHNTKEFLLEKEHQYNLEGLENEKNDRLKSINGEYYQDTLQEFRDFQTSISQLEEKATVRNEHWGITNMKQTNKNNRELLASYEAMARQIIDKRSKITEDYKNGVIDENVYKQSIRELDSFSSELGTKIDGVKEKLSFGEQWKTLAADINNWVQEVGSALNSVLGSIAEIQSNQYDAMIDQQQKYIDEYEKLLQKQEEITQDHSDRVNSIEDELSTARGDRRQHLIDQLNAEMTAQRESLAQEKRIQKEKEKAEEEQKRLEVEQARAKKKMQLAQAVINMAMSISMAAVNSWPIPAIPMMALASATGAAQIAAIQSQNIPSYGDGGVIQGKSHKEGGVKVLGGRAEVEGGEFITNKATTQQNVQLLEYINTKKRRVNLDDMIEFYSSGKAIKKSISTVKTKFADGGQIPYMRTDIDMTDRLITAFEDYSNRPNVVSVVDIIDRTQAVNEVRTLAGIEV